MKLRQIGDCSAMVCIGTLALLLAAAIFMLMDQVQFQKLYKTLYVETHKRHMADYAANDVSKAKVLEGYENLGFGSIYALQMQGKIAIIGYSLCSISSMIGIVLSLWLVILGKRRRKAEDAAQPSRPA
jgi:hypothetical protein